MLAEAPSVVLGSPTPRIGPPLPLRHDLGRYRAQSAALGIIPMPWQDVSATYLTALDADDLWAYREVAIVVGRQNGKTTLTKPLVLQRLLMGRRIMHIAQVRELPRIMFEALADAIEETSPGLLPRRRGKIIWPRRGAGSESIVLTNGGEYRIASAITGARGFSFDDLLIDELREMDSFDVINAAKPAQRFSPNAQTIYLSNAGTDDSVILNSLRTRGEEGDPNLAYLEWSADPMYRADDVAGWLQANPAIGHYPQVLRDLEKDYLAAKLAGNLAGFETEALCRWVPTMRERLVDEAAWMVCKGVLPKMPRRVSMAVSMDPQGSRASAAVAWQEPEGVIALRLLYDVTGDPIDSARLGMDMKTRATKIGATDVGFDPMTDAELAKFFPKTQAISGQKWTNASAQFVNLVKAGRIRWDAADAVADDLMWTSRKLHEASETQAGTFEAVRSKDDRPITAALAAIRAIWLASGPKTAKPRIY